MFPLFPGARIFCGFGAHSAFFSYGFIVDQDRVSFRWSPFLSVYVSPAHPCPLHPRGAFDRCLSRQSRASAILDW
jgi:hypothetical protein